MHTDTDCDVKQPIYLPSSNLYYKLMIWLIIAEQRSIKILRKFKTITSNEGTEIFILMQRRHQNIKRAVTFR